MTSKMVAVLALSILFAGFCAAQLSNPKTHEETAVGTSPFKCTPLFVAPEPQAADTAYPLVTDPDAYDVYSSVLHTLSIQRPAEHLLVIVSDTKARVSCCEPVAVKPEWKEALSSFIDANKGTWKLQSQLIPRQYQLISEDELNSILRIPPRAGDYKKWQEAVFAGFSRFRTRYPTSSGYVRMSAVGFNQARNRAIVYVEDNCGYQCGHGSVHYLERDENGWHQSRGGGPWCAWIS